MTQTAILQSSDNALYSQFGTLLIFYQNTIMSGVFRVIPGYQEQLMFLKRVADGKIPVRTLSFSVNVPGTNVGSAVAINGNTATLSSRGNNASVYLFDKGGDAWKNSFALNALFPLNGGQFGFRLAMDGDIIVVGDPSASTSAGGSSGAVFYFAKVPTILNVTSSNPDGIYGENQVINVTSRFFSGRCCHRLSVHKPCDGQCNNPNSYLFRNCCRWVVNFTYTVQKNDTTPRLNYTDVQAMGGTFSIFGLVPDIAAITTYRRQRRSIPWLDKKNIVISATPPVTGLLPDKEISVLSQSCE